MHSRRIFQWQWSSTIVYKYSQQIFWLHFCFPTACMNEWAYIEIFGWNVQDIYLPNFYVFIQGYIAHPYLVKHKVGCRHHYHHCLMGVCKLVTEGAPTLHNFGPGEILKEGADAVSCQRHCQVQFPLIHKSTVLTSEAVHWKIEV